MPLLGESIRLNLQLWDGATNKFVLAYLYDSAGLPLGATPSVILTHIGHGLYMNNQVLFPTGTPQVKASYKVFNDAGFTQSSRKHSEAVDVFNLETTNNTQVIIVDESILIGKIELGDSVLGIIEPSQEILAGEFVDEGTTVGGVVESSQTLIGLLEDEPEDTIPGPVQNGTLQGTLEC